MASHAARSLVLLARGAGWGLTHDSAQLHLAIRLRTALGGGLSPGEALAAIAQEPRGPFSSLRRVAVRLPQAVAAAEDGASLGVALAESGIVAGWERRLIETGERSGRPIAAMDAWIEALRLRASGLRVLPELLAYPCTLVIAASLGIAILSWQVMPTLAAVLTGAGMGHARAAEWAVWAAGVNARVALVLLVLAALFAIIAVNARSEGGALSRWCGRILDGLPFLAPARRTLARCLGLEAAAASLAAGDGEGEAFRVAAEVQSSGSGRSAWLGLADAVSGSEAFASSRILSPRFLRSLQAGLRAEDPSAHLRHLARRESERWWRRAESTLAFLEPLLVLGLGLYFGAQAAGWWILLMTMNLVVKS